MENCIKIAIAGNVDAGKSSLIGVLSNKKLDDGRGSARNTILRNKHEKLTGRTSCISYNNIIYEFENIKKVITLIDLAGHEKYLKTTMFGLTGLFIDYGIVVVGANMGITKMTKEHLGILLYLRIPIIVLITKVDICPDNIYEKTRNILKKMLKVPLFNKKPYFISLDEEKATEDMDKYLQLIDHNNSLIPVLSISNKTGQNISCLNKLISNLKPRKQWDEKSINGSILYIDSTFIVHGIGLVISGTLKGDPIHVNQKLWIGPVNNKFIPIKARSLHNNIKQNVTTIYNGEVGCMAIKFTTKEIITREQIIKGVMIFSDSKFKKNVSSKFKAKITILNHSTTICNNYQPVIHCGPIRQSAKLTIIDNSEISSDKICLRTGNTAIVLFTFMFHPEYLESGLSFFFRDGNTKGYGDILEVIREN